MRQIWSILCHVLPASQLEAARHPTLPPNEEALAPRLPACHAQLSGRGRFGVPLCTPGAAGGAQPPSFQLPGDLKPLLTRIGAWQLLCCQHCLQSFVVKGFHHLNEIFSYPESNVGSI